VTGRVCRGVVEVGEVGGLRRGEGGESEEEEERRKKRVRRGGGERGKREGRGKTGLRWWLLVCSDKSFFVGRCGGCSVYVWSLVCAVPIAEKRKTAGKWWKCDPISEHRLRSSRHGLTMNLVDWLRTSADEQVLSGRRAVVICVMGCLRGLVVLH